MSETMALVFVLLAFSFVVSVFALWERRAQRAEEALEAAIRRADEWEKVLAEPHPDTVRLEWVLDNCTIYARDRNSTQIGDRETLEACINKNRPLHRWQGARDE